jgi:hypothetical protein
MADSRAGSRPASRTTFETLAFTENRIAARVTYA